MPGGGAWCRKSHRSLGALRARCVKRAKSIRSPHPTFPRKREPSDFKLSKAKSLGSRLRGNDGYKVLNAPLPFRSHYRAGGSDDSHADSASTLSSSRRSATPVITKSVVESSISPLRYWASLVCR